MLSAECVGLRCRQPSSPLVSGDKEGAKDLWKVEKVLGQGVLTHDLQMLILETEARTSGCQNVSSELQNTT